ncbi:MAG: nucleotide exchange factor GrpE [Oscillospiraceae bacterium]|nr:nucleotide exchange factor GrpE [Oscillospiraceae bacterium]
MGKDEKKKMDGINPEQAAPEELEEEIRDEEQAQAEDTAEEAESAEEARDPLEKELEALQSELEDAKDKLLRTAAEYDNYRKRTEREKRESASFGAAGALEKLLPAVDALERAAEAECSDAEYKKGLIMTLAMFENAFANIGLEEIEALGADFDPTRHNAVASDEPDEEHPSGTVTRVLQKGYRLGERVIRPAMVAVAS